MKNKTSAAAGVLLSMAILLSFSCRTLPGGGSGSLLPEDRPGNGKLTPLQAQLIDEAHDLIGAETLTGGGRTFSNDCIGIVMALYARVGIVLDRDFAKYSGNGVARLYQYLDEKDLLYNTQEPEPGDIVFWDNTWDANEDGKFNDPYTHAGVVINRLDNDILEYIHYNYRKGVVFERMNLKDPDTRTIIVEGEEILINSPMRARSAPRVEGKSLASQLIRSFGSGYELDK